MDLFSNSPQTQNRKERSTPLPERVRPKSFSEVLGQEALLGENGPLASALKTKNLHSFVLWGPPGSGKTTIAQIFARDTHLAFVPFSAVMSGIKEVKAVMQTAQFQRDQTGNPTIVFIDEIHRFNKAQQDAFLPFVERGDVILIGATTENPSFEMNNALLSRLRVYLVEPIRAQDMITLVRRALETDRILSQKKIELNDEALTYLVSRQPGDARATLQILEALVSSYDISVRIGKREIDRIIQKVSLYYDKNGEEHYNIISALHKSMRNGDPDAALYWLGRMIEGGEDPLYIVRRLIRFASEDVGNADPQALILAMAVQGTVHFIGMPEGKLALTQLVIYLALAPKSNSVYQAYQRVERDIRDGEIYPVPLQIRNAPTKLMKEIGYGEGYQYAHNTVSKTTELECLPPELQNRKYYVPVEIGFERDLKTRKEFFERERRKLRNPTTLKEEP